MHNRMTIWIAKKVIVEDLGSVTIVGYDDLQKIENATVVQANNFKDIQVYGNEINNVIKIKIQLNQKIDLNGDNAIYLKEPQITNGYYTEPDYISSPINVRKGYMYFDGKKQIY